MLTTVWVAAPDPVTSRNLGGIVVEELLKVLDTGVEHPSLLRWLDRRTGWNWPAPSLHDEHHRDLLGVLQAIGINKTQAWEETCKRLRAGIKEFPGAYQFPLPRRIRNWVQRLGWAPRLRQSREAQLSPMSASLPSAIIFSST
jgi:hypothetical protein